MECGERKARGSVWWRGGGWWLVFLVMSSDGFLLHAAGHAGTCWTTFIAVDAYLQALQ